MRSEAFKKLETRKAAGLSGVLTEYLRSGVLAVGE